MAAVDPETRCVLVFGSVGDRNGDSVAVEARIDGTPVEATETADAWTLAEPACGLAAGSHLVAVSASDPGGLTVQAEDVTVVVPEAFVRVDDTLNGHLIAQRFRFYATPAHFGAADVSFVTLLVEQGTFTSFPLYQVDDDFFANRPAP